MRCCEPGDSLDPALVHMLGDDFIAPPRPAVRV